MIAYRPSIDGLRALAVLSVCCFHLNHKWLPGGFIGVDVFFVISGYLITSIIARDCHEKKFSFVAFYQRRVARILPASLLTALVSLGLAVAVYTSMDAASAGAATAAAVAGLINCKLLFQGNYFESSLDAQPLLHYWSLSLEEQFYLIYPAAYVFLHRRVPKLKTYFLLATLLVSLFLCIVVTPQAPAAAFYLLPTRAWELLAGGILASLHHDKRLLATIPGAGIAGLAMLVLAVLVTPNSSAFPGLWPLLPVAGTAMLLSAVDQESRVNRALSVTPMLAVGRMSYSLYLWHWPIFSFIDYAMPFSGEIVRVGCKFFITSGATFASYHLFENPCRIRLSRPGRGWAAAAFFVFSMISGVGLGLFVRESMYISASPHELAAGGKRFVVRERARTVALVGDSLGSMYAKSLQRACAARGLNLVVLSVNGGDPLPGIGSVNHLWEMTRRGLQRVRPDLVVLACDWRRKLAEHPQRFGHTLRDALFISRQAIVILQQPFLPPNATRAGIRAGFRPPFHEDADSRAGRLAANEAIRKACGDRCQAIDSASFFETDHGDIAWQDELGRQLFQDRNHLSGVGADRVVDALVRLIDESGISLREVGDEGL